MYGDEDKELSKAYLDIINGYSQAKYSGETVYIKHFGLFDESEINENYQEVYDNAQRQGLPTEKERLEVLESEGFWTKKDEREVDLKKAEVRELEIRLSKTIIKTQKEKILKNLSAARGEIDQINSKRNEMLHDTCESFSRSKSMNFMIWLSFYKDKEFGQRFWSKEEFDELPRDQINDLVFLYNSVMETLSAEKVKKLSLSPIFTNYFYLSADNVSDFFGKKVLSLTFLQTTLASWGKTFKNVQENNSDIPEGILDDPDALIDFAKSKSSEDSSVRRPTDSEGGYSRVGATNQDMIDAGVSSSSAKDLHAIAKEKGGTLGWQDFA